MKKLNYQVEHIIGKESEFRTITEHRSVVPDDLFESELANIKSYCYNGEVTVEDIPDEPAEPTQLDRIEAQTMFTALMTDTLLEEV